MTDKQCERCGEVNSCMPKPEPKPVGWIYEDDEGRIMFTQVPQNSPFWEPVYRARKQWQGLTDKERSEAEQGCFFLDCFDMSTYSDNIEAKLKAKNDS